MNAPPATPSAGSGATDAVLAELLEQFLECVQAGGPADPAAFAAEHPAHAEELLAVLPAAAAIADLRDAQRLVLSARLDAATLGDYRIVREVGRGGMGVVYEAEQVSLGRRVALKVLPEASATDPRPLARFRVEAQAAATLSHPHIVPVLDFGCEAGVHYYAMPFIDGCPLSEVLAGRRPWPGATAPGPRAATLLALQAAEALDHAHALGVLHRDIKPANLLVDPSGHLWVTDFGLARLRGGCDLTRTGDVIGTLRYLSPEQAAGRPGPDPRSDVYGLGATLYELLTLRPPFDADDRRELLRRIVHDEPAAPRQLDPSIPRDLETVVLRALAKEPRDRYATAGELADDLRRFLDGRPVLARRPGPAERAARWAGRHRTAVTAASVVLGLAVTGLVAGAALLWREQARTRENLRAAVSALDQFCLSAAGMEYARDPERAQEVRRLQIQALAIYERVLAQNAADPEARWAAARAHHRIANILAASLHRPDEVERAYREADRLLTALLAADPGSRRLREEAADTLGDWGAWLAAHRPREQAALRRALAGHRRLAAEFPGEARFARSVSRDCLELSKTMGIVVPAQGAEKERLLREAVALRRSLQGGSPTAMADLAEAYALLAHLLIATRRPGEGEELMSLARGIARRLKDDFPADPTCRHQVVLLESLIASPRYCAPADREAAVRAGRSVLEAKARLVADFPFIPDFRAELAWSHHYLSGLLRAAGRPEESEAEDRRAVEAFEAVLKDHPSVESYGRLMAMVCEEYGTTLAASDRPRDAVPYLQRALDLSPGSPMRRDRVGRLLAACQSPGAPVDAPAAPPSSGAGTAAGPSRVH